MAFPYLPLIAGAAVGSLATYLLKNRKSDKAKEEDLAEIMSTDDTLAESGKPVSDPT